MMDMTTLSTCVCWGGAWPRWTPVGLPAMLRRLVSWRDAAAGTMTPKHHTNAAVQQMPARKGPPSVLHRVLLSCNLVRSFIVAVGL